MKIQHTVVLRLNDGVDNDQFCASARRLSHIAGVINFEVLRQVGAKSDFTHALSMWFDDQSAYDGYLDHPAHLAFVNDVWLPDVAAFLELDYVRLSSALFDNDGGEPT
ncbi:MAG TPA: Dabb family protein [Ilumatobacteraceae bacterium]|nr:Dabb family protein [Ilumatobacteraceae bacterium]